MGEGEGRRLLREHSWFQATKKFVDKKCATNGEQILEPCNIINFYWE